MGIYRAWHIYIYLSRYTFKPFSFRGKQPYFEASAKRSRASPQALRGLDHFSIETHGDLVQPAIKDIPKWAPLVGGWATPWKMMEFVSWDDDTSNIWKNKSHVPNHQPDYLRMIESHLSETFGLQHKGEKLHRTGSRTGQPNNWAMLQWDNTNRIFAVSLTNAGDNVVNPSS